MKNIMNSLNRKILKVKNLSTRDCNCRSKTNSSFNRYCFEKGIYKATIYCPKGDKKYVDLLEFLLSQDLISISVA